MKNLNYWTLLIFAPVLLLTGTLGFILPAGPMSAAAAYNIFHIAFGALGAVFVLSKKQNLIRGFNVGFGILDLYQALASFLDWFPETYFKWTTADDILHIVIGALLVLIGLSGRNSKIRNLRS